MLRRPLAGFGGRPGASGGRLVPFSGRERPAASRAAEGRRGLGQTAVAPAVSLQIQAFLQRRALLLFPLLLRTQVVAVNASVMNLTRGGWPRALSDQEIPHAAGTLVALEAAPYEVAASLLKANSSPTDEDLVAAELLDMFFGPAVNRYGDTDPYLLSVCRTGRLPEERRGVPLPGRGRPREIAPLGDFLCPPWTRTDGSRPPIPQAAVQEAMFPTQPRVEGWAGGGGWDPPTRAAFWGIAPGTAVSEILPHLPNMLAVEEVLVSYPFPTPFGEFIFAWNRHALPKLREFARSGEPLPDGMIRSWITLSVLENYEAMARDVEEYLEEREERARRRLAIMAVATVAIGGLMALAALPALAVGAFKAVSGAFAAIEKEELKAQMAEAADAFRDTDPAFSREIAFADEYMRGFMGDEEAARRQLEEGRAGAPPGTALFVGGGIAAAGLLALLLFR